MPLFVEKTATLFDYLPSSAVLVLPESLRTTAEVFYSEAEERYQQRKYDIDRPLLKPEKLFLSAQCLLDKIASFASVTINNEEAVESVVFTCNQLPVIVLDNKLSEPAQALQKFISTFKGKILFVAESAGRREALIDKLRSFKISVKQVDGWQEFLNSEVSPCVLVAPMEYGLYLDNPAIAIITENQLSGEKVLQRRRRRKSAARELENIVNNLNELTIGSPVVHRDHGVGRYLG